ncbi:hypothetical protein Zmor_004491 [Zophobas morio]|uniref:non-specific serine/threonine protein kinase n=1 Tax=Zophobas morio TaxID=2755281 RepID=A0AA38LZF1_9CUCU|nr:hypothetical protein Zmor_004491 [Zophobas morio]
MNNIQFLAGGGDPLTLSQTFKLFNFLVNPSSYKAIGNLSFYLNQKMNQDGARAFEVATLFRDKAFSFLSPTNINSARGKPNSEEMSIYVILLPNGFNNPLFVGKLVDFLIIIKHWLASNSKDLPIILCLHVMCNSDVPPYFKNEVTNLIDPDLNLLGTEVGKVFRRSQIISNKAFFQQKKKGLITWPTLKEAQGKVMFWINMKNRKKLPELRNSGFFPVLWESYVASVIDDFDSEKIKELAHKKFMVLTRAGCTEQELCTMQFSAQLVAPRLCSSAETSSFLKDFGLTVPVINSVLSIQSPACTFYKRGEYLSFFKTFNYENMFTIKTGSWGGINSILFGYRHVPTAYIVLLHGLPRLFGLKKFKYSDKLYWAACFEHFKVLRAIGRGSFGKVCIVKKKDTRKLYAMKYMNKQRCIDENAVLNVLRERKILGLLFHNLLVNLWFAFQDPEDLYMVMDLMLGGDLRFHLNKYGKFTPSRVRGYMAEISCALEYIHSLSIIHRDIKPDNLLLDNKGHVHLADFNVATFLRKDSRPHKSCAGTKYYMAPEMLAGEGYGPGVDWWSLGVTMYELLSGSNPYYELSRAVKGKESELSLIAVELVWPEKCDENTVSFLKGLLERDPSNRLGTPACMEELRAHQYFKCLNVTWKEIESLKIQCEFVPSESKLHCDATYELEELLLENNPLHKKKQRLKKYQPIDEPNVKVGSNESKLLAVQHGFRPFNREKSNLEAHRTFGSSTALSQEFRCAVSFCFASHDQPLYYFYSTYASKPRRHSSLTSLTVGTCRVGGASTLHYTEREKFHVLSTGKDNNASELQSWPPSEVKSGVVLVLGDCSSRSPPRNNSMNGKELS